MLENEEYKVLKKIAETQVITKYELVKNFSNLNPQINKIIEKLLEKGYIARVSFGTNYLVITNSGMRAIWEYEK